MKYSFYSTKPRDAGTSPGQRQKTSKLLKIVTHLWLARKLLAVLIFAIAFPLFAEADVLQLYPEKDTYIDSKKKNNSYGNSDELSVKDGGRNTRETLLQFNLSQIPEGTEIVSAKLKLYAKSKKGNNNATLLYTVLGNWNESTTWNNKPTRSSIYEDSVTITTTAQYYEWDLTVLVLDWIDGIETNYGIYVVADRGTINFNSREAGINVPRLMITYEVQQNESPLDVQGDSTRPTPDDTGVSDAPLYPADRRVIIVAQDGSGQYTSIKEALDSALPGDTIQVKNGTYIERVNFKISGTREEPIALVAYLGHFPIIDPGGGDHTTDPAKRVEFNAEWIILDGFEIRYGWDGVKLYKGHNTIRNNWIHNNKYQGILIISTDDVFIEYNIVEYNGTDEGTCIFNKQSSPRHCHGVYVSDFFCTGTSNITIRGNITRNHGGRGIQWNGEGCSSVMTDTLVENNIIKNNAWGVLLYYNVRDSIIRNNTFIMESYPSTNSVNHYFIGMWESTGNIFKNNIFHTTRDDVGGFYGKTADSDQNEFDYNIWNVRNDQWYWKSNWREDFRAKFQSVSGWEQNGQCCDVDPQFH
ncbi:DNRLRE domain-containing protein [Desulfobacterota bacterium AH_259_B03_O07]|nr:DNRLRE domain-containing protein [Desulfobacterota bacterium AH_259_B03_O07]